MKFFRQPDRGYSDVTFEPNLEKIQGVQLLLMDRAVSIAQFRVHLQGGTELGKHLLSSCDEALAKLNRQFLKTMEVQTKLERYIEAAAATRKWAETLPQNNDILTFENFNSLDRTYPRSLMDQLNIELNKVNNQNVSGSDQYSESARNQFFLFHKSIWDTGNSGVMFDEKMLEDYYEDEVFVSREDISYICPLTKTVIVDAVRGPCGHYYSKSAIRHEIKSLRGTAPCPIAGCSTMLKLSLLRPAPEFEAAAQRWVKRMECQRQRVENNLQQL